MSAEEKYLIALGNLQSMAIDNTKGSKAVEICANDIRDYLDKYKIVLDKIKDLLKEYKYTNIEDYSRIIEFYRKLESLLEEIE